MEFYTEEKMKALIHFAMAWKELESIMLSAIFQAVREKYQMIPPLTAAYSTEKKRNQNIPRYIQ